MARISEPSREPAQPSEFDRASREYLHLKVKIDDLKAEQDKLKPVIAEYLDANVEPDDSGHRVFKFDEKIEGFVGLQRQRRVKRTPDVERAVEILTELGMFEECIEFKPQINEDAVWARVYEGDLTSEQVDEMFPQEVTYALVAKRR